MHSSFDSAATANDEGSHEFFSMSEPQCSTAFPGLFDELDKTAQRDVFYVEKEYSHIDGHAQGRITDGKVGSSVSAVYVLDR